MLKAQKTKELCPQCPHYLTFYREWTDDGHKERAWVECGLCGWSEERTFENKELEDEDIRIH